MAAAGERGQLWNSAKARRHHAGWKLQSELVRRLRSWGQRLGMVRRYLQGRHQSDGKRLGRFARRFVGHDESSRNAILLPERHRSERSRRDLRISLRARAGRRRKPLINLAGASRAIDPGMELVRDSFCLARFPPGKIPRDRLLGIP